MASPTATPSTHQQTFFFHRDETASEVDDDDETRKIDTPTQNWGMGCFCFS